MGLSPAKAKEHCGYDPKPAFPTCSSCAAFASDFDYPSWCKTDGERASFDARGYAKNEKNMRCTDHGFATKKSATCRLWRAKSTPQPIDTPKG